MATSESKGELVIPIMVVQSFLLLSRPFVPKIVHVEHRRVTVNPMTCASQEQPVDQKIVLLLKPVLNVLGCFQMLIVVSTLKVRLANAKNTLLAEMFGWSDFLLETRVIIKS